MDNIESKQVRIVNLDVKSFGEDGSFAGYGSVFGNTDSYNDVVTRGAFASFLRENPPENVKLLWQHDSSKPIGVYTKIYEDEHGLYVEGKLLVNEVAQAAEAYALLKAKAISGLSIGFSINPNGANMGADGKRYLTDLKLWEISLVTFPANAAANVSSVKKLPETIRDFEEFLRDAGFERRKAKSIASIGFKEGSQCDAEPSQEEQNVEKPQTITLEELTQILQSLINGAKL